MGSHQQSHNNQNRLSILTSINRYSDGIHSKISDDSSGSGSKIIPPSQSFSSTISYPFLKQKRDSSIAIKDTARRLVQTEQLNNQPYSCIGFIALESQNGSRTYATGFLMTNWLVITAANTMHKRDPISGEMTVSKPKFFFLGEANNRKIFQIIQTKIPEQYIDINNAMCSQDYQHASISIRKHFYKNIQAFDFAMLRLDRNAQCPQLMQMVSDFQGEDIISIAGYDCDAKYDEWCEQDRETMFQMSEYNELARCSQGMLSINTHVGESQIGSPIIVKDGESAAVIGIMILQCQSQTLKLRNGLPISCRLLDIVEEWMVQMGYIPKIKSIKNNNSFGYSSRKNSEDVVMSNLLQNRNSAQKKLLNDKKNNLIWNFDCPNASKFQISARTIKKITYDGYIHQITTTEPLSQKQTTTVKVRILKYGGRYPICIGLTAQKRMGKRYSGDLGQKKSIGFWSFNYGNGKGRIFVDGEQYQDWSDSLFLKQNSVLSLTVYNDGRVGIRISSRFQIQMQLPQSMKNQNIYLFVAMQRKNDSVQLVD